MKFNIENYCTIVGAGKFWVEALSAKNKGHIGGWWPKTNARWINTATDVVAVLKNNNSTRFKTLVESGEILR